MRAKALLVCGLLAMIVAACGDDSEDDAAPAAATTSTVPKPDYVTQVNRLCEELIPKVLEASGGGHPTHFPVEDYNAERPKRTALFKAFDAKVDAIEVAAADRSAADAFDAFRHESDAADVQVAAAAATGKQARSDTAIDAKERKYESSSVVKDLEATGIRCPVR